MDHNLNMIEFYHDLIADGDQLRLVDDQLQYRPRHGQGRSETLATLRQHRDALITWLRERAADATPYPLSQGQLGVWLDWQRDPETPIYNLVLVARLQEAVQVEILHQTAQLLLDRHPALRTVYSFTAEQPHQQVQIHQSVDFAVVDGTTWSEAKVQAWIEAEADRPFDLTIGPLMRMRLLQIAPHGEEQCTATAARSNNQQSAIPCSLLHCTWHHIATDLFTLEILQEELRHCYRALLLGEQPRLPTTALTHRDFVRWEAETLHTQEERLSTFWQRQLGNEPVLLNLPVTARAMQSNQAVVHSQSVDFSFDPQLVQQLRAYARTHKTTLYMLLLAAYQVLISRYTGQERFFITSPTAVRDLAGWSNTVGYFVNPILLHADLQCEADGTLDFTTLLRRTQGTVTTAMAHHLYPYHAMLRQWHRQVPADQLQQGLVGFVFDTFRQPTIDSSSLFSEILVSGQRHLLEPLTLFIFDSQERLSGRIVYQASQFDSAFIKRMAKHFTVLLNSIVTNPAQRLSQLPLLTAAERQQLLVEWNETQVAYPHEQCIHQLFEAQVARTPDVVAVVSPQPEGVGLPPSGFGPQTTQPRAPQSPDSLTYAELNVRANHLAHYLQSLGVGPDVVVGMLAPRGLDFLTAILAIFKAGGAYLPLEPQNPLVRHAQILQQSQSPLLLCADALIPEVQETLAATVAGAQRAPRVLSLEASLAQVTSPANPMSNSQPHDLAYVIFTSGSTGLPKGAMIEQRGMVNHLFAKIKDLNLVATDRVAQTASQAFDISVWQFLAALLVGGSVYIYPDEISLDPKRLLQQVEEDQITIWEAVPSLMRAILESLQQDAPQAGNQPRQEKRWSLVSLRWLIPTGEALPPTLANQWLALYPQIPLLNAYGPTECSDDVTHYAIYQPFPSTVVNTPIGRPVCNMCAYILDSAMQLSPIGVPGELWIGGIGVGRGYLYDPERTAAAFISNPFSDDSLGANAAPRLYKTGDLARWLPDGNIEYLGRLDHQVKLRGFRIELGEIEAVLRQHPAVHEAVVLAREDTPGEKRLVAYVVPKAEMGDGRLEINDTAEAPISHLPSQTLRSHLQNKLPEYMVPGAFVLLDALPLTPNGKLDRKALPVPDRAALAKQGEEEAAQGAVEVALAAIWGKVLRLEIVSRHANFFEVGGDSIAGLQVINQAHTVGIHLKPRQIFEAQTIARLAAVAEVTTGSLLATPRETDIVTGSVPLLPIQHAFFAQHQVNVHHFNQSILLKVERRLDGALLREALAYLLQQHDALRLRFTQDALGVWQQAYAEIAGSVSRHKEIWEQEVTRSYEEIDLSQLPSAEQQHVLQQTNQRLQRTLNINTGPLWRIAFLYFGDNQPDRLLFVIHHLAVDLVSWHILLPDLWQIYEQLANGQTVQLPAKGTSYQAWAHYLQGYAQSEAVVAELPYWQALANQCIAPLPVDYALTAGQDTVASAALVKCSLSRTETEALLQEVPAVYHTQINDLLLTALVQSFTEWTGQTSLLIDLEGHGREDLHESLHLANTVGWFTALFPHLLQLPSVEGGGMGEAIQAIKEQNRQIPQHGIGYGLLRYLNPITAPQLASLPHAEVSFNYGGQFSSETAMDTLGGEWDGNERLDYRFNINGAVVNGQLSFTWLYSQHCYRAETVECLAQGFITALQNLIAHCQSPEAGGYTPSDFPLAQLDAYSFAKLAEQISSFKQ